MPKFVLKEMECLYLEELRTCINTLMANLESLPVARGAEGRLGFQKLKRYNHKYVLYTLVVECPSFPVHLMMLFPCPFPVVYFQVCPFE